MIAIRHTSFLICAILVLVLTYLVNTQPIPDETEDGVGSESDPLALLEGSEGDDVDFIVIGDDEDPRGIVLRRWRRFIRSVLFHPFRPIKKIVAAMIIPGTIAGAIAGTVASSIVGVGAGGVTGGIAGAGLGGLGGILVPSVRLKKLTFKKKNSDLLSKVNDKSKKRKKVIREEDEVEENEDDDEDDEENDEEEADDEDEEGNDEDLGRNVPSQGTAKYDDSEQMVLFLRGGISVDRLYELRNKMKLLKIKKKFQTKQRHFLWN